MEYRSVTWFEWKLRSTYNWSLDADAQQHPLWLATSIFSSTGYSWTPMLFVRGGCTPQMFGQRACVTLRCASGNALLLCRAPERRSMVLLLGSRTPRSRCFTRTRASGLIVLRQYLRRAPTDKNVPRCASTWKCRRLPGKQMQSMRRNCERLVDAWGFQPAISRASSSGDTWQRLWRAFVRVGARVRPQRRPRVRLGHCYRKPK
jgi:hypothetical protein